MSDHDIKVLEKVLEECGTGQFVNPSDTAETKEFLAALSHAIAALKAKSDAEQILEWCKVNKAYSAAWSEPRKAWMVHGHLESGDPHVIHAPTLADLAAKLKG